MSPFLGNHGYLLVAPKIGASRKKLLVHRLVAKAFVRGHFPDATVNHINGVKVHNVWTNLEWVSLAENTHLEWETGLVNLRGENHPTAKLSANQVHEIRRMLADGLTTDFVGRRFGVSASLISMISTGRRWASLPSASAT